MGFPCGDMQRSVTHAHDTRRTQCIYLGPCQLNSITLTVLPQQAPVLHSVLT